MPGKKVNIFMGIRSDRWTTRANLVNAREDRAFRKKIASYNDNYGLNGQTTYILHGPKGYKLSDDPKEIAFVLYSDLDMQKKLLKQTRRRIKNMNNINQMELPI